VKIKEEKTMEIQKMLLDLEEPAGRINDGIDAIKAMVMGLSQEDAPYSAGFHAVWSYLDAANRDFQEQVEACLNAR